MLRLILYGIALVAGSLWAGERTVVLERGPAPDGLYAIGDVHGDVERLSRLLSAVHLAAGGAWTGGRSVLVVTGDMVEKGPHSVGVLRTLAGLRANAAKSGGQVIVLAGNHEVEFLADPGGSKTGDFVTDLKRERLNPAEVGGCKTDVGEFLCSLPIAARVGDWFFSHAGNTSGRSVARLNSDVGSGMAAEGYATSQLMGPASLVEARLGEGKKWFASPDERGLLASYAAALGVKHMVQGHQHNDVQFGDGVERHAGEMFQRWGLLFLIDTGMSRDVGDSQGAVLRVRDGKAVAVCASGKETLIWDEGGDMQLGRAAACQ